MKSRFSIIMLCILLVQSVIFTAKAQDNLWTLSTSDLNAEYVGAPVANGGIGILPWNEPFSIRYVMLNHVFDEDDGERVSMALYGINPFLLDMQVDGAAVSKRNISDWSQTIDMREATHNTSFTADKKVKVDYSICALRNMPYAGLIRIEVEALKDVEIRLCNRQEVPDGLYGEAVSYSRNITMHGKDIPVLRKSAYSKYRRNLVSASSAFLHDRNDKRMSSWIENENYIMTISLKKGDKCSFALAGAVVSDRDFIDPKNESNRQIIYTLMEGSSKLMEGHRNMWDELWQGDIRIEGDDEAQRVVRFALYNLYSYVREGSGLSLSPMGLSARGYNGHVFWDTEIWMYPPLLYLNQGIAQSLMDYRTDRVEGARRKAEAYGYKGAMFPWESDDAGEESTPTWALTGPLEHHITADIAIAAWNFYRVSGDSKWLQEKGWPLIKAVAEFWVSRVTPNDDGSFSILNVVCADEYAEGVDDNAFTNGAVIRALEAASDAAAVCGETADPQWKAIAENLRILKMDNGVTAEYDGYDGRMIKQADVNLIGYPLGLVSDEQMRKDLEYYIERIDKKNGPAMSYAVFCVQYARLGDAENAYATFRRAYAPNLRPPFGVIAETATSMNPYFATGAGGLLQAVICGFGGLEITDEGIIQVPSVLPKHWKKLTITGVGKERRTFIRTN